MYLKYIIGAKKIKIKNKKKIYTSAFESAGIVSTYSSVLKSVGIGLKSI